MKCVARKDSSCINFERKKEWRYEEYIFNYLLPQKTGSKERWYSSSYGTYHCGRNTGTVQLQDDWNPNLWDTKGGRMIGKSMQALEVNRKLDKMRVSISKHYQEIMDRDNFVTADKVKNAFVPAVYYELWDIP